MKMKLDRLKKWDDLTPEEQLLMRALDRRGETWTTKRVLSKMINIDMREIAKLASGCDGMIISTTKGLRLLKHSSTELAKRSYNDLANKARSTGRHATAIMRRINIRVKYAESGQQLMPGVPAPIETPKQPTTNEHESNNETDSQGDLFS